MYFFLPFVVFFPLRLVSSAHIKLSNVYFYSGILVVCSSSASVWNPSLWIPWVLSHHSNRFVLMMLAPCSAVWHWSYTKAHWEMQNIMMGVRQHCTKLKQQVLEDVQKSKLLQSQNPQLLGKK